MILTAHQPAYLPWLGLFHKIALSDAFCHFDDVQFEKDSFTNRNKIKTQQGSLWLTVPVSSKGHTQKRISEIKIDNAKNWKKKHWKAIEFNYKKTRFWKTYKDFFENVYEKEWKYLAELNEYMLKWFLKELKIDSVYSKASELHFEGHKSDLVLDMCKKLHADAFIFGALGKDYAKKEVFAKEGVRIYFQDYKHPVYPQLYGDFMPYMSIIDLLFNCGDKSLEILMHGNINKEELQKELKK